jgi:hypothetical protein
VGGLIECLYAQHLAQHASFQGGQPDVGQDRVLDRAAPLDAAYKQHFAKLLRTRRAVADVATWGKRLKPQIAELEWLADTGQDVTGQPPGRPKRRRNSHEHYR